MKIEIHKQGIVIIEEPLDSIDDIEIYSWGKVCQFVAAGIISTCGFWALSVIMFTL